jgi:23S rRNA C2498 (ribose-2'-O)-methylase RlmM
MARTKKQVIDRAVHVESVETRDVEPMADNLVTVKAVAWLNEDGVTYKPGDEFKTSPARADSLVAGNNVKVLS